MVGGLEQLLDKEGARVRQACRPHARIIIVTESLVLLSQLIFKGGLV